MRKWLLPAQFLFAFLAIELLLQAAAWIPAVDRALRYGSEPPGMVASGRGHIGNPAHIGHDDRGFRNDGVLSEADIVVLGDQHSYGAAIGRDEALPARLAAAMDASVYDMSVFGFSPGHNALDLDDALALRPKIVVQSVYLGNDIHDRASLLREQGDPRWVAEDPTGQLDELGEVSRALYGSMGAADPNRAPWRLWVGEHVRSFQLARALKNVARDWSGNGPGSDAVRSFEETAAALSDDARAWSEPVEVDGWRTHLTTDYRLLNFSTEPVAHDVAFQALLEEIGRMRERVETAGARFAVLLFPTKERVVAERMRIAGVAWDEPLARLVAQEDQMTNQFVAAVGDATVVRALSELALSEKNPFFESIDAHPNAYGQAIAADMVADALYQQLAAMRAGAAEPADTP